MCQNLIINLPYCEKWVRPELLFLRQRSAVWSGAPSSPPWGLCGVALGVAAACVGWGPLPSISPRPLCSLCAIHLHHVSDSSLGAGSPFPDPQLSSPQIFLRADGQAVVLSALGGSAVQNYSYLPLPPPLSSVGICCPSSSSSPFPAELGVRMGTTPITAVTLG